MGKYFLVCHYLKGVFDKIKPVPKYNKIWSVGTVLDCLSLFWPLDEIIIKELTLKLVMVSDCLDYWAEISDPDSFGHIRVVHAEERKLFHFCPNGTPSAR